MNPFLGYFLAALFAQLVFAYGTLTFIRVRVARLQKRTTPGERLDVNKLDPVDEYALRQSADFDQVKFSSSAAPAPAPAPSREAVEEAISRAKDAAARGQPIADPDEGDAGFSEWQNGCMDVLFNRVDPKSLPGCPMCGVSFARDILTENGPKVVHLCPVHGRGCAGCPTVHAQFEEYAKAQGIENMAPVEQLELARLRSLADKDPRYAVVR